MAKTNVKLNSGSFSYEDKTAFVNGGLSINDTNAIQNINGQVRSGELSIGSFDAYRNGDNLSYNLHPTSISVAAQLATIVEACVTAVEAQITPVNE